ncbi:MAG: histidine phosphatase family protein [Alphaproteobacteria bacterium]|nr:histidine phosphatase family protein [Alphaproteobacteria bacterium]MCW5741882.1 histidine phosphatase family protein [Alphaproteobacteria bacterium]
MLSRRSVLIGSGIALLSPWATSATPADLAATLRAGGLNIYFRHSLTLRQGQPDDDLSSCERQRNLTDAGRQLASRIGAAFRALAIPVGAVRSSPYCRCVDTARLAFGRVEVVPWLETDGDESGEPERARLVRLRDALAAAPARGVNDIFVGHGNNLGGLAKLHGYPALPIAEAESVVFRPGTSPASVLARRTGPQWVELAGD